MCSCMRLYAAFTRHGASINKERHHLCWLLKFVTQRVRVWKDDDFHHPTPHSYHSVRIKKCFSGSWCCAGSTHACPIFTLFHLWCVAAVNGERKQCAALELLSRCWCECVRWKWTECGYALNFNWLGEASMSSEEICCLRSSPTTIFLWLLLLFFFIIVLYYLHFIIDAPH